MCSKFEWNQFLIKICQNFLVQSDNSSNENLLQKYFNVKMITCVFKSLCLKCRVAASHESTHCKLVHRLDTVLIDNLVTPCHKKKKNRSNYCIGYGISKEIRFLQEIAQMNIDFASIIADENGQCAVHRVEWKIT